MVRVFCVRAGQHAKSTISALKLKDKNGFYRGRKKGCVIIISFSFFTNSVLVIEHFFGQCPQFNLQMISGVGIPVAVQLMMNVTPGSTSTFGGGETAISGGAEMKRVKSRVERKGSFCFLRHKRSHISMYACTCVCARISIQG